MFIGVETLERGVLGGILQEVLSHLPTVGQGVLRDRPRPLTRHLPHTLPRKRSCKPHMQRWNPTETKKRYRSEHEPGTMSLDTPVFNQPSHFSTLTKTKLGSHPTLDRLSRKWSRQDLKTQQKLRDCGPGVIGETYQRKKGQRLLLRKVNTQ